MKKRSSKRLENRQSPENLECETGSDHPETETLELEAEMKRFRTHLLANAIINNLIPTRRRDGYIAVAGVTAALAIVLFLITTIGSEIVNGSAPVIGEALLASALTASSFAIIKLLHDGIFPQKALTFPESLPELAKDGDARREIARWFRSFLKPWKQLLVSTLFGVAGFGTLLAFARYAGSNFKAGSYALVSLCFFAGGHGAYCSLGIPTLIRRISKHDIALFWLSPADTPWVKEASWIFTKLALADAFVFGWAIIGLYLLKPLDYGVTTVVALIWLLIGLAAILFTFLFPHYYLNQIIRAEKKRQVERMQRLINAYLTKIKSLDALESSSGEELKKLTQLVTLYERLAAARESAIDMRARVALIPSVAFPVLSFFGRGLVELGRRYNLP